MMLRFVLPLIALSLAACASEPAEQESADDFAARIGGADAGTAGATPVDPAKTAEMPNTAVAVPPAGADVTQLEQLRDIAGVDFGPRDGGCTFMDGNREVLIASGMNEPTLPGKAVIRVGGGLTMLDAPPGGLEQVKKGATFTGEGVTVTVAPAAGIGQRRPANMSVSSADGKTVTYSGNWICA